MNDRETALAGALDQIAVAFGKEECLTPEQHRKRAERDLAKLVSLREGLAKLAAENGAKDRDEQGWTTIDPLTAHIVAWYLRKEADSDNVISESCEASDALEEVADQIESGEILACPEDMLFELDEQIVELRALAARIVTEGEDPAEGLRERSE